MDKEKGEQIIKTTTMEQKILDFISANKDIIFDAVDINIGVEGFIPDTYYILARLLEQGKIEKKSYGIVISYKIV